MRGKSPKEIRNIMIAVVVTAMVIGGASAIYINKEAKEISGRVTATVIIDFENGTKWAFSDMTTKNATVFGFLMEAARNGNFTVEYTYYGQYDSNLVDSIAGKINGENNSYWQYWINGEYGMVGADRQPVKNGNIIEWTFTEFG